MIMQLSRISDWGAETRRGSCAAYAGADARLILRNEPWFNSLAAMLLRPRPSVLLAALALGAPTDVAAAWETQSLAGMQTRIYTPSTTSKIGTGRGLLIALHGCTQQAAMLADHGNFEPAAEEFGFVVAIPDVPGGGVVAGCWDYYGALHTRTSGHNGAVIGLAEALRDDSTYGIDPDQIYLSGLSSGGGQAVISGCLAPEVFAGIGVLAGPAAGTTITQISSAGTTGSAAADVCRQLAGDRAPDLETQLALTFTDSGDFIVAQDYALVNAEMYAELFAGGLSQMTASPVDVSALEGAAPVGQATSYSDGTTDRILWLKTDGVGHAWPSGSGESPGPLTYVSGAGPNIAYVMAERFTANNSRADGDWDPSDSDSGGGDDGTGSDTGDSGDADTATSGPVSTTVSATDSGADPTDADETSGAAAEDPSVGQGCACRATPPTVLPPDARWALLVLACGACPRRRSHQRPSRTPSFRHPSRLTGDRRTERSTR
jgi:poly(3-hydroxybutyrate) depolymerase